MEEIFESAKENVIGPIKCSPVLPSAQERFGVNQVSSPLSVLKESQHENIFYSPDSDSFPKITRFLSTPVPKDPDYKIVTNSWDEIRKLDEEELWIERTQVVTKEDHILYSEVAKEAVNSIIEKLPIRDMDDSVSDAVDSSLQESANETVVCVEKEEDAAADENVNDPDFTSLVAASDEAVVSDEKKEETETDIKTIRLDTESMQLPDQHLDKSVLEDNAFIHSCSDLDETVKEILADEEPVSPKKFDDIEDSNSDIDNDKTICNDQATENTGILC